MDERKQNESNETNPGPTPPSADETQPIEQTASDQGDGAGSEPEQTEEPVVTGS